MLKRWIVLSFISGYIVLLAICVLIISRHNRYVPTEPLPLRTIAWQEIGTIRGIVDLDADRNDELIVQDKKGHWWWVKWGEKTQRREPLPVPAKAELFWFHWRKKRPEILVFVSNKQGIIIARNRNGWQKRIAKQVLTINRVASADLDGDGHLNDALLVDGRHLLWLKREPDGRLRQQDQLLLPNPFASRVYAREVKSCWWESWVGGPNIDLNFAAPKGNRLRATKDTGLFYWGWADIDGDGKLDHLQWRSIGRSPRPWMEEFELRVWFFKAHQPVHLIIPSQRYAPIVNDLDGDNKAEIVVAVPDPSVKGFFRLTCWRYDAVRKSWQTLRTQLTRIDGQPSLEERKSLLSIVFNHGRIRIWRWWLEKGKWQGKDLGKLHGSGVLILSTQKNLFVVTRHSKPYWLQWLWERLQRWSKLTPLSDFHRLWIYREGKGWQLLAFFPVGGLDFFGKFSTFDLNGDSGQELIWTEFWHQPQTVCIGEWNGERWRVGKFPLPSSDWHGRGRLRSGKRGWLIYQNRSNYRCIAVTVR